jgi:hypothetical protein
MKLFEGELDKHMNLEEYIDVRVPPEKLLRELNANEAKKLIKVLDASSSNPFKLIRTLTITNLIIINSKGWFEVIEKHLKHRLSKDDWINVKFLEPYYRFIIKSCASKDLYNTSKNYTVNKG